MSPLKEQLTIAELNPDGYIECYEDLDCPDPVEVPENKTISSFSCSGEMKSQLCLHRFFFVEPSNLLDKPVVLRGNKLSANCARGASLQFNWEIQSVRGDSQVEPFVNVPQKK